MAVSFSSTGLRAHLLSPQADGWARGTWTVLAALTALGMLGACSAPPGVGGDDDEEPQVEAYGGPLGLNQPASANPNGSASNGSAPTGSGGPTSEGSPNGVQLGNNGNNTGSGQVGAANPTPGAGGAPGAMAGNPAAGGASMLPQQPSNPPPNGGAGSANMPPGQQPQQPPPMQPPVQPEPPFVGPGCDGNAFFCEDFETFNVGAVQANALWRAEGNVTVDSQVALGSRSLRLQAAAGQNSRILLTSFAPPNNSFFGRMNIFVDSFPTAQDNAHFVMVEVTGNGGEKVRPIGGQFKQGVNPVSIWGVGSDGGSTGDWTDWQPTAPTAAGRWVCMEWRLNASTNGIDVWIDGTAKPELSASTNDHGGNQVPFVFPAFNNIWLGWWLFQNNATPSQYNVRIDDIVLSSARVGC